jgi:glycosyltransferase involved in cell wall biosynthesis
LYVSFPSFENSRVDARNASCNAAGRGMTVGIYITTGEGLGGADGMVAELAGALALSHDVEIIHHKRALTAEALADFAGVSLDGVTLRYLPDRTTHADADAGPLGALKHYIRARRLALELAGYDLLIYCTVNIPLPCLARRGLLVAFFPWAPVTGYVVDQLWKTHLDTYQRVVSISEFARDWARRRWSVDSVVIAPPVDTNFPDAPKTNTIVTTGRFVGRGRSKRQLELMRAFVDSQAGPLGQWEYVSAGGVVHRIAEDRRYFDAVVDAAAPVAPRARAIDNLSRPSLKTLYQRSKIFWYGAGLGEDERDHPELLEHFGIVTVEAMAAGCVPVVINKGGQPEIVRHGIDGFVWNTPAELIELTMRLAADEGLRLRMSRAARERASAFSRETFAGRYRALVDAMLAEAPPAPQPPSIASALAFVAGRKLEKMLLTSSAPVVPDAPAVSSGSARHPAP